MICAWRRCVRDARPMIAGSSLDLNRIQTGDTAVDMHHNAGSTLSQPLKQCGRFITARPRLWWKYVSMFNLNGRSILICLVFGLTPALGGQTAGRSLRRRNRHGSLRIP
jgi:hypothetical protein